MDNPSALVIPDNMQQNRERDKQSTSLIRTGPGIQIPHGVAVEGLVLHFPAFSAG